jgi:hypothetical protein
MTVYTNLNKMTTNPKYNIVIDVDRLKYPFTGMHQFCLHLYKTLSRINSSTFFYKHKKTELPKT